MAHTAFPQLFLSEWEETRDTLQKYCRMVGTIREVLSKPLPHSLHTNLLLCEDGFTTSSLLKNSSAPIQTFEVIIDLIHQRLRIKSNYREPLFIALTGQSLSALCDETCSLLADIGITPPLEKPSFLEGSRGQFDPKQIKEYWRAANIANGIMKKIKAGLRGETNPVQLRPDDLTLVLTWFVETIQNKKFSLVQQVEFGFSAGDENIEEAYFYISTFPDAGTIENFIDERYLIKINNRSHKAMLPCSTLISNEDAEKAIMEFFVEIPSHFKDTAD